MLCLVQFLSPYKDRHKSTNHSKLNDSPFVDFYGFNKFGQLKRRSGFKHFNSPKMELFVTRVSCCFLHFCRCCRLLDLLLYKCKKEEAPKVPWCITYLFISVIRFKRSRHWPIFETGFGRIMNSWFIRNRSYKHSSSLYCAK